MNRTLRTRNFTLVTVATTLGALGSIAGGFALSFFFDETGSTLASALIGFLGSNSAIRRSSAVQRYIPKHLRDAVRTVRKVYETGGDDDDS